MTEYVHLGVDPSDVEESGLMAMKPVEQREDGTTVYGVDMPGVDFFYHMADAFTDAINHQWANDEPIEFPEYARYFMDHVWDEVKAQLLLQLFDSESPVEKLSKADLSLAKDVAEALGPDHAQKLYHFAVIVTKLA